MVVKNKVRKTESFFTVHTVNECNLVASLHFAIFQHSIWKARLDWSLETSWVIVCVAGCKLWILQTLLEARAAELPVDHADHLQNVVSLVNKKKAAVQILSWDS